MIAIRKPSAGRSMRCDEVGATAVEFAIISTILLILLAASVDIVNALVLKRDLQRKSDAITYAVSACRDSDCVLTGIQSISKRKANVLIATPSAALGMASVSRANGVIRVEFGTMTYLPADIQAEASKVLSEGDFGICTLITLQSKPLFSTLTDDWNLGDYRAFTCALRAKRVRQI